VDLQRLTHKHNAEQVLITAVHDDVLDFVIPGTHPLAAQPGGMTTLYAELVRQAGEVAMQLQGSGAVARESVFTMHTLSLTFLGDRAVHAGHVRASQGPQGSLDVTVFDSSGRAVLRGGGVARQVSPAVYRRMRGSIPSRVPRQDAARVLPNMMLGWDEADPFLFDHPLDHVPGMAFVDAVAVLRPDSRALHITFERFAELDADIRILEQGEGIEFTQHGQRVALASVRA
jgi:hypothetical protein